jgi:hypothetical protein
MCVRDWGSSEVGATVELVLDAAALEGVAGRGEVRPDLE